MGQGTQLPWWQEGLRWCHRCRLRTAWLSVEAHKPVLRMGAAILPSCWGCGILVSMPHCSPLPAASATVSPAPSLSLTLITPSYWMPGLQGNFHDAGGQTHQK